MERIKINLKQFDPSFGSGMGKYYEDAVSFFGEQVGFTEAFGVETTIYDTPNGYRVVEEDRNGRNERVELKPSTGGPFPLTSRSYGYLTQAQVLATYPLLAPRLGTYRDI